MMNQVWITMIQQIPPNGSGLTKTGNQREHTQSDLDAGGEVLEGRGIRSSQQLWKYETQVTELLMDSNLATSYS